MLGFYSVKTAVVVAPFIDPMSDRLYTQSTGVVAKAAGFGSISKSIHSVIECSCVLGFPRSHLIDRI